MSSDQQARELHECLRRAAEWRLLALLFERPTDGWAEDVRALASEVSDTDLKAAAAEGAQGATEGFYHALLGPAGPARPRGVSYHRSLLPGAVLSAIAKCYEAFAFQPEPENPPDHIAVMANFVGYLAVKEGFALTQGEPEKAEVAAEASARLQEETIRPMGSGLLAALEQFEGGYLTLAARCLVGKVGTAPDIRDDGAEGRAEDDFGCTPGT